MIFSLTPGKFQARRLPKRHEHRMDRNYMRGRTAILQGPSSHRQLRRADRRQPYFTSPMRSAAPEAIRSLTKATKQLLRSKSLSPDLGIMGSSPVMNMRVSGAVLTAVPPCQVAYSHRCRCAASARSSPNRDNPVLTGCRANRKERSAFVAYSRPSGAKVRKFLACQRHRR